MNHHLRKPRPPVFVAFLIDPVETVTSQNEEERHRVACATEDEYQRCAVNEKQIVAQCHVALLIEKVKEYHKEYSHPFQHLRVRFLHSLEISVF